jgi:hypothetical protein
LFQYFCIPGYSNFECVRGRRFLGDLPAAEVNKENLDAENRKGVVCACLFADDGVRVLFDIRIFPDTSVSYKALDLNHALVH